MRKIQHFILLAIVFTILISCSKDDPKPDPQTQNTIGVLQIKTLETGVKTQSGTSFELSDVKSVIITIEKDGKAISNYENKELKLENWGENNFTISDIELENGENYEITSFELKNKDLATTFASPKNNSKASNWVQKSLPIKFNIVANQTTEANVQVVTTLGSSPDIFGYNKFTFIDQSPQIQSYLKNFEAIFANKGDSIIHHFTQRGIPTYSDIYRKHLINKHVTVDYVKETFRHYYINDQTPIDKLDCISHNNSQITTYNITKHHPSGNISNISFTNYSYQFDNDGKLLVTEKINRNGKIYNYVKYYYDDKGNQIEAKYYNVNNQLTQINTYTFDDNGNVLTENRKLQSENSDSFHYTFTYNKNNLLLSRKYFMISNDSKQKNINITEYTYNSKNLLTTLKETKPYPDGDRIKTKEYIYENNQLIKSIHSSSNPNDKFTIYYDALGNYLNENQDGVIENIYDFRGRILERKYTENEYKISEILDNNGDLIETRYSKSDYIEKIIFRKNSLFRLFWENGRTKLSTYYTDESNIPFWTDESQELNIAKIPSSEFIQELFKIRLQIVYNNKGEKKSHLSNALTDNSEIEQGIRLSVSYLNYENNEIINQSDINYYFNNDQYNNENLYQYLYKYTISYLDITNDYSTYKEYDKNGNIIE